MSVPARSIDSQESGMISRVPQRVFDRLFDASLITIMGLPLKDPHEDDDEDEDPGLGIIEPYLPSPFRQVFASLGP
jgi:hypothetical protein